MIALSKLIQKLSICLIASIISGGLAGLFLTILSLDHPNLILTNLDIIYTSLILALFTWLVLVFIFIVIGDYLFRSFAWYALINCLITCFMVVFVCAQLNAYSVAWIVGFILGFVIGWVICKLRSFFL